MSGYVKGRKTEWKKIVWPTRKELVKKTGVVIAISAVTGILVSLMDMLFQNVVNLVTGLF